MSGKPRKLLACGLAAVLALALFALAACSTQSCGGAPAPTEAGGFEEYPLGDDILLPADKPELNVAGVYFQPVDMEPAGDSLSAAEAECHIEADISAAEGNDLGYGVGDFVPNLTVDYEIADSTGKVVSEGTFMPMNASDGPHYGANVKLDGPGKYKITFIIESPEKQGYLLHVDKETGVPGKFWKEPIVVSWDFDFVPRSW